MKHVLILAAAIIIALSSQAVARLGNTEDQVNALLGKPTDLGKPDSDGITTNMYKNPTGEYIAVVQFLNGRSVAEAYSRTDRLSFLRRNCRSSSRGTWLATSGKRNRARKSPGYDPTTEHMPGSKPSGDTPR